MAVKTTVFVALLATALAYPTEFRTRDLAERDSEIQLRSLDPRYVEPVGLYARAKTTKEDKAKLEEDLKDVNNKLANARMALTNFQNHHESPQTIAKAEETVRLLTGEHNKIEAELQALNKKRKRSLEARAKTTKEDKARAKLEEDLKDVNNRLANAQTALTNFQTHHESPWIIAKAEETVRTLTAERNKIQEQLQALNKRRKRSLEARAKTTKADKAKLEEDLKDVNNKLANARMALTNFQNHHESPQTIAKAEETVRLLTGEHNKIESELQALNKKTRRSLSGLEDLD